MRAENGKIQLDACFLGEHNNGKRPGCDTFFYFLLLLLDNNKAQNKRRGADNQAEDMYLIL